LLGPDNLSSQKSMFMQWACRQAILMATCHTALFSADSQCSSLLLDKSYLAQWWTPIPQLLISWLIQKTRNVSLEVSFLLLADSTSQFCKGEESL
jgi:hypothetical protein